MIVFPPFNGIKAKQREAAALQFLAAPLIKSRSVRKIPARAWLLSLLSSGLLVVIFPRPNLFFLGWIAMAPLLFALLRGRGGEGELVDSEGRSLRPFTLFQGFLLGWTSSFIWYLGTVYWTYTAMHGYGGVSPVSAVLITILFCMIMALDKGAFGLLIVLMARRSSFGNRGPLLLAPVFWAAIEFFHDRVMGFAWNPLGGTQIDNIPFARIAEVTGVYGLSFAVMLVNCAFVAALLLFGQRRRNLLISAAAAAIALQMGVFANPAPFPADRKAVLVQGNIPLDVNWTQDYYQQTLSTLAHLTLGSAPSTPAGDPGLAIWPESPAPFYLTDQTLQKTLVQVAAGSNSYVIAGVIGETQSADGQRHPLNSALVMDPRGQIIGRYDKIHLVPFGEYVPLRNLLFFARSLTSGVGEDTARGTERKVFELNGAKAGINICYEIIYPDEIREFVVNGAQVIINISDDAWYGESGAPFQQLQMARMRAIENHRWVLISTNSGVTAAVDPYGRIIARAPRNIRTALPVQFSAWNESTFYTRNGDVFAWICVVISIVAVFVRIRFRARTMIEARPA